MKTKYDLLQSLIYKFDYKSYLEIGCDKDTTFSKIIVENKIGVDPLQGGTHRMTSDHFFSNNNKKFDLIFVDGLHESEQVQKDVDNSLLFLNEGGTIVMHDCNPHSEELQSRPRKSVAWNGDVWKVFVNIRSKSDIDSMVADFDWGCGVLRIRPNSDIIDINNVELNWSNLVKNRNRWLRLSTFEQIMDWV